MWLKTFHILYADEKAELKYMKDCLRNLLVLKNSQLYDINYLRFRTICRTKKYSYPTLNFYDPKTVLIGNPDFNSTPDSWIRLPRKQRFYSPSLYISRLLEDGIADNFHYGALAISLERRNSSRIRKDRGSRYCGNKSGTDCNTMSLTYVCRVEFCGWFWI